MGQAAVSPRAVWPDIDIGDIEGRVADWNVLAKRCGVKTVGDLVRVYRAARAVIVAAASAGYVEWEQEEQ